MTDDRPVTTFRILSEREYQMTRVFAAPRDLVYQAYTDPAHIPHWWGPREVTTVVDVMDVRPGGAWRFIQHHADGSQFAFRGEYREVAPPERLVYTFGAEFTYPGMPRQEVPEALTFEEHDGTTLLIAQWSFQSVQDRDGLINSGAEGGMRESWDRLAAHLASIVPTTGNAAVNP